MTIGIYKIVNMINDKYYIGSSINIEYRWKIHQSRLRNQNHINILLQRAWNKYGSRNFELQIIETCEGFSREDIFIKEQNYLDNININSYNLSKFAKGGDNISDHPNKEYIIQKIKQTLFKRYSLLTQKERDSLFSKCGNKNGMYGKNHSDDTKRKISDKLLAYYHEHNNYRLNKTFDEFFDKKRADELKAELSKFASQRIGNKNPFFGKHHNEITRKKISENHIGQYHGNQNKPVMINGIIYTSLGKASNALNIHITTIRWRTLSNSDKFKNYIYVKVEN